MIFLTCSIIVGNNLPNLLTVSHFTRPGTDLSINIMLTKQAMNVQQCAGSCIVLKVNPKEHKIARLFHALFKFMLKYLVDLFWTDIIHVVSAWCHETMQVDAFYFRWVGNHSVVRSFLYIRHAVVHSVMSSKLGFQTLTHHRRFASSLTAVE